MRTDMEIQKDVVAELRWEPSLRDDDIFLNLHVRTHDILP